MSYSIELADDAVAAIIRQPVDVRVCIVNHLDALAERPTALSRRASFPYRPNEGQLYEFWCEAGDVEYFVTVFFRYAADETTLQVHAVTARPYEPPDAPTLFD